MSENNKEKNLPDKDYFHNFKSKKEKRNKQQLSENEKKEFAEAFGDEEDDVKTYLPGKKAIQEKVETVQAAQEAPSQQEDMYALPEFNSDEFFASLGFGVKQKASSEKQETEGKKDETLTFTRTQALDLGKKKAPAERNPDAEKKASDKTENLGNTRHFNLRSMTKKIQLDKNKKNFMQNFRVLSKDKEDRAILEAAPVGNGGKGLADSVKPKKGEDVFEAVEKAYLKKDEATQIKIENSALRKQRDLKGIQRGNDIKIEAEKKLEKEKKNLIACGALLLVFVIMTAFFSKTPFYPVFSLIVSLVLFVAGASAFIKGFKALKNLTAVPETAFVVMSFFVVLHNIIMISLKQPASTYTICIIFAVIMRSAASYFFLRNRIRLVTMATKSKRLSILQRIPVNTDTSSFSTTAGDNGEPDIFFCAKAYLDVGVEEPEYDKNKENKYFIFTTGIVLLASLVVGLLSFTTHLTGMSFISALTATICALVPIMYDPMSRYLFFVKGKGLLDRGACISGREALQHISSSDGFVLDAKDVFAGEIHRFRKSSITKVTQNDSAVFAAAIMYEAGSVLAPCFDSFVQQLNFELPVVENFQYEERLGYSAWIMDRKVLVGSRQMLLNHSITVPSKEHEKAYGKGRFVMYVVVDGEISATFLVNYKVLSSLRQYSRDFSKTGLMLMFSSREAFLNEEVVASKLSLDIASVKVLSAKATAVMDKYNSSLEEQSPTGLICSRKNRGIMHLIMGCYNLSSANKFVLSMMITGQVLGILLLVAAAVLKMTFFVHPVAVVILRLIWCAVVAFMIERKK